MLESRNEILVWTVEPEAVFTLRGNARNTLSCENSGDSCAAWRHRWAGARHRDRPAAARSVSQLLLVIAHGDDSQCNRAAQRCL